MSAGVEASARDVEDHINRARRLFRNRMPAKAWPELRFAAEQFAVISAAHPGTRETLMLRTQLTSTVSEALTECQQMRDASKVVRAGMCEALEKVSAAIPQTPSDGAAPFGGPRRRAAVGARP